MTKDEMAEHVGFQADWREEKAREHPHDAARNLDAARSLRQLSKSISAMPDAKFERLYSSRMILAGRMLPRSGCRG